jgi:type III pantothenate kinase
LTEPRCRSHNGRPLPDSAHRRSLLLLAIDVGNTQVVVGLGPPRPEGGWRARWRLETSTRRTADEYGALLGVLLEHDCGTPSQVHGVVLSSVVPALTGVLGSAVERLVGVPPLVIGPGVASGMEVRYSPPASLGSDRLADAVAARARYGAPVVAVDFGTATTLNVVSADGAFAGGCIAPGIGLAADALAAAGARLHRVDLFAPEPPPLVGRSTEQSLRSGALYGYAGLVAGLLRRIEDEIDRPGVPIVATGGLAAVIAPLVERIDHVDTDLTLDGLRHIYHHNQAGRGA